MRSGIFIRAQMVAGKVVAQIDYDFFTADEAREIAHTLLCEAEKVDGNSCIIACFTRQGDCLPADKEIICKKIEELADTTGEIDGVVVFKQKEIV